MCAEKEGLFDFHGCPQLEGATMDAVHSVTPDTFKQSLITAQGARARLGRGFLCSGGCCPGDFEV